MATNLGPGDWPSGYVPPGNCTKGCVYAGTAAIAVAVLGVYVATHPPGGSHPLASPTPATSVAAGPTPPPARPPAACPGAGVSQQFQDPEFQDSDWSDFLVGPPTTLSAATFSVLRGQFGEGPDGQGDRASRLQFAGKGVLTVMHLQLAAVYDPGRCGPVTSIDASFSVRDLGAAGSAPQPADLLARTQAVAFAIRQGGTVYWSWLAHVTASERTWTPAGASGMQANEFVDYLELRAAAHPDFTAGPLGFGYVTVSRCAVNMFDPPCAPQETNSALGAWHVTVHR